MVLRVGFDAEGQGIRADDGGEFVVAGGQGIGAAKL